MIKTIEYGGWPHCRRIQNEQIELIVTGDVGPRVIRLAFREGPNFFAEFPGDLGKTGGDKWRIYGGHRLWHAPEERPRTYFPDNQPVKVEIINAAGAETLRLTQSPETTTGIEKQIDITLDPTQARVKLRHRLRHTGTPAGELELAPWALSVMAPGGTAVIPLPPRRSHAEDLLPRGAIALWSYTDMGDPRWTWGGRFVLLRQDSSRDHPQKAGFLIPDGWAAYLQPDGRLFIKRFGYKADASYPDMGVNAEFYTNGAMLEVETLAPLSRLTPGAAVEHTEEWFLFNVPDARLLMHDDDARALVLPYLDSLSGSGQLPEGVSLQPT